MLEDGDRAYVSLAVGYSGSHEVPYHGNNTTVLGYGHKGRKKRSARSCGVVGRQFASVEKFCAWRTPEIRIGVGIFDYQYAVQAPHFNKPPKRTIQEALIPSPLVSP